MANQPSPAQPSLKKKGVYVVPQEYVDSTMSDLANVLQTARAVPSQGTDGKFNGFQIQSLEKKSEFRKLGILPGDVITRINDVELDNAGRGIEAFQKIRSDKVVKVHLLRKRQKVILTYEKLR